MSKEEEKPTNSCTHTWGYWRACRDPMNEREDGIFYERECQIYGCDVVEEASYLVPDDNCPPRFVTKKRPVPSKAKAVADKLSAHFLKTGQYEGVPAAEPRRPPT